MGGYPHPFWLSWLPPCNYFLRLCTNLECAGLLFLCVFLVYSFSVCLQYEILLSNFCFQSEILLSYFRGHKCEVNLSSGICLCICMDVVMGVCVSVWCWVCLCMHGCLGVCVVLNICVCLDGCLSMSVCGCGGCLCMCQCVMVVGVWWCMRGCDGGVVWVWNLAYCLRLADKPRSRWPFSTTLTWRWPVGTCQAQTFHCF